MNISWWVYFVTGLSYVLQQPPTAGLAKTKADITNESAHSCSSHCPKSPTCILRMITFENSFTHEVDFKCKADPGSIGKIHLVYIAISIKWFWNSTFNTTLMHRLQQKTKNIGMYQYSEHEAVLLLSIWNFSNNMITNICQASLGFFHLKTLFSFWKVKFFVFMKCKVISLHIRQEA